MPEQEKIEKEKNPELKNDDKTEAEKTIIIKHKFEVIDKEKNKLETNATIKDTKNPDNKTNDGEKKDKDEIVKPEPIKPTNNDDQNDKNSKKIKELEEQLQERESQLGTIALKEFETQKETLLKLIPDEKRREYVNKYIADDPEKLEEVAFMTTILQKSLQPQNDAKDTKNPDNKTNDGEKKDKDEIVKPEPINDDENPEDVETPPPKGVAGLPEVGRKEITLKQVVDEVYKVLGDPDADPKLHAEATRKATALFDQFIKGRRKGIIETGGKYSFQMVMCPNCHKLIMGQRGTEINSCPYCKKIFTKRA